MTLYLLNLSDLLFTLHATSHGGVELNPLMSNIPFMVFYKTIVMGALIWWLRKRINLLPLTIVFAVVNAWHIINIGRDARGWIRR
jgi:hypothetical protein